ncbi:PREDICTED: ribonuclease pancreatic [Mesitornis unicolor]|nr:PREDICTED: ribonuclease pancreatic [Mesitornis unicolor]
MANWALCLAVVLAALAGAVGESRYEKFLRQHVDHSQTPALAVHRYCETMMARRRVTAPGRPCKPTNTFVHAPAEELVAACAQAPDQAGVHSTPTRAQQLQHHGRVTCLNGLPVHLAGTHAPPEVSQPPMYLITPWATSQGVELLYHGTTWVFTQLLIACILVAVESESFSMLRPLWTSYSSILPLSYGIMVLLLLAKKPKQN